VKQECNIGLCPGWVLTRVFEWVNPKKTSDAASLHWSSCINCGRANCQILSKHVHIW